MAHGACGCVLGLSLAVYFASVGVSLQEIFGPKFYVYFVKGWTSKGRGSRYRSVYREYIGITEKHPDERKQEHMVRASKKGAKWLDFVEIEGSPVVLYETDSEERALKVELFAVLWRMRRRYSRPYRESGKGGKVRGAWLLRTGLHKQEMDFIATAFGEKHPADEMPVLPCLRDAEVPTHFCITEEAVEEGEQWFNRVQHPADLRAHMQKECFECRCKGHVARYCPVHHHTPEAGRYKPVPKAQAKAKAKVKARAGEGLQWNYHRYSTYGGKKRCGEPGAESPGPCVYEGGDEYCAVCERKALCAAGNGGARKRKFSREKCGICTTFDAVSARCVTCKRKMRRH